MVILMILLNLMKTVFLKKNQQLTYPVVTPSFIFQFPVRY